MASAQMVNCNLLWTQAASIKHLYFNDVMQITNDQPWQNSKAKTLCYEKEPNAIAMKLTFCYISIKK
jgi:hypothetical protein